MSRILKKYIADKKVIRTVKSDGLTDIFGERDMIFRCGFNTGLTPRWAKFDFKTVQTRVLIRVDWGENSYKMYEFTNVTSATISMMPGIDGNGGTIGMTSANYMVYIYLSEPENITKFETTTNSTNNRIGWETYWINPSTCYNISELKASQIDSCDLSGIVDLPLVRLNVRSDNGGALTTEIGKMSTLKYCILNRLVVPNLSIFHSNLRFLSLTDNSTPLDIASFFNSPNRMGFEIARRSIVSGVLSYGGGSVFSPNITEDAPSDISAILSINTPNYWTVTLTPDMVSRFLVDFANQVKSVSIVNKIIKFNGMPANTSYEDFSQPLYKNYTDAINYIRNTLGVTVTF
ncbi:hypothetical protein [Chryseobacterium sp. R2A-55]|uniref:hypothetical protein n=1 Tax=Chryseobacterium sp. R2A-55 TaxID=2744445 RepID=UPI001F26DEA0|nr:hypothetical protein [Chryseobacterium sp. R2A-55]